MICLFWTHSFTCTSFLSGKKVAILVERVTDVDRHGMGDSGQVGGCQGVTDLDRDMGGDRRQMSE